MPDECCRWSRRGEWARVTDALGSVTSAADQADIGDIHALRQVGVVSYDFRKRDLTEWDESFDDTLSVRRFAGELSRAAKPCGTVGDLIANFTLMCFVRSCQLMISIDDRP